VHRGILSLCFGTLEVMTEELPIDLATGAFSTGLARARGIPTSRMRNVDLERPFWGVRQKATDYAMSMEATAPQRDHSPFMLRRREITRLARLFAPRLAPDAAYSGPTAAVIHGMPLPARLLWNAKLDVVHPFGHRAVAAAGVIGHQRNMADGDVIVTAGLPITSAVRTWCDLAPLLSVDELIAVGDWIVNERTGVATIEQLTSALITFPGRRGLSTMQQALPEIVVGSYSDRETAVRMSIIRSGFPRPIANFFVGTVNGHPIHLDLAFPDYFVGLEYEGDQHRTDKRQWGIDLARGNELQTRGWATIRDGGGQAPSEVMRQLASLLRSRVFKPPA
jgi:hypothetical protein